jgi:hypothetical protein
VAQICEPLPVRWWRRRKRTWVVVSLAALVLVGGVATFALWPPLAPSAAAFVRWQALEIQQDPRANALRCRDHTEGARVDSLYLYWIHQVGPQLGVRVTEVTVNEPAAWASVRVDVSPRSKRSWRWSRPSAWFSQEGPSASGNWFATMSFEDNEWKVCTVEAYSEE